MHKIKTVFFLLILSVSIIDIFSLKIDSVYNKMENVQSNVDYTFPGEHSKCSPNTSYFFECVINCLTKRRQKCVSYIDQEFNIKCYMCQTANDWLLDELGKSGEHMMKH